MKKVILCLMLACSISAFGQNALKFDFDNKIISASSFSMPQSSTLEQVLQVLPELLHRPNDISLENYDLKIEGLTVGDSKDAILSQVMLMDIEKIEITNSALSNYESNGQGGVINIVLKPLESGTSGNAFAMLGMPSDYIPGFSLNNLSKNWTIRSFFTGEYAAQEDVTTNTHTTTADLSKMVSEETFNEDYNRLHQMAKLFAFYKGENDVLKFSLSEMLDKNNSDQDVHSNMITTSNSLYIDNKSRKFDLMFKTEYNHTFAWNGTAKIELLYHFNPSRNVTYLTYGTNMLSTTNDKNHSLAGKVEYSQTFYWGDNGNQKEGSKGFIRFEPGCNYNYSYNSTDAVQELTNATPTRINSYHNLYIAPYLTVKSHTGNWNFMAKVEYQIYNYRLDAEQWVTKVGDQLEFNNTCKDLVGTLVANWNINQNHALRLMANSSVKRPSESQVFPYMLYSISKSQYEKGNSILKPITINNVELEYIFNHDTGVNKWQITLGGRYIHTNDNIVSVKDYDESMKDEIVTWRNGSHDNILNANAMVSWKHNWFAVTATANYFDRHENSSNTCHRYCNLSIMPQVQTNNDWNICALVRHNTKLVQNDINMPSLTILGMLVSKTWKKRFTVFLSGNISMNHKVDYVSTLSDGDIQTKTFVPFTDDIYAGIRYNF